jgi:hypothetical protein
VQQRLSCGCSDAAAAKATVLLLLCCCSAVAASVLVVVVVARVVVVSVGASVGVVAGAGLLVLLVLPVLVHQATHAISYRSSSYAVAAASQHSSHS